MANPLDLRGATADDSPGKYDPEGLRAYCATMNAMNFVQANGWEYFVNKRTLPNGKVQHYVDRRDGQRFMPRSLVNQARAALVPPRDRHPGHADS